MKTDWDSYYQRPYKTASFSRKITGNILCGLVRDMAQKNKGQLRIAELGGGNSAFYKLINDQFHPQEYFIIDNNQTGLKKFVERIGNPQHVHVREADVLQKIDHIQEKFDLVYSIGLIEHFDEEGTRAAIRAHLQLVRPGGSIIITYPTPTFLYRFIRKIAEWSRMWIFHDERPLSKNEVETHLTEISQQDGNAEPQKLTIEKHFINWWIFLTQAVIVLKKESSEKSPS